MKSSNLRALTWHGVAELSGSGRLRLRLRWRSRRDGLHTQGAAAGLGGGVRAVELLHRAFDRQNRMHQH